MSIAKPCAKCGETETKRLGKLYAKVGPGEFVQTEFRLCKSAERCRKNRQVQRPAKMVSHDTDTRECGWMGCGHPLCEEFCTGQPRNA